jgi:hypothetical protein
MRGPYSYEFAGISQRTSLDRLQTGVITLLCLQTRRWESYSELPNTYIICVTEAMTGPFPMQWTLEISEASVEASS